MKPRLVRRLALIALVSGAIALKGEPGRRAALRVARRAARWVDSRIEGSAGPNTWLYERLIAPAFAGLYERVADDVAAEPAARGTGNGAAILDLGCGPGDLAVELAGRLHEARIVGLDLSPGMIELAQRHEGPDGQLRFVAGDAARLPFEAGSFDVVVSTLSLHHWAQPDRCFAEIKRVLRPGGVALVYDLRLLTIEPEALPELARKAGLAPDELRDERLGGGAAALFARFRLEIPAPAI